MTCCSVCKENYIEHRCNEGLRARLEEEVRYWKHGGQMSKVFMNRPNVILVQIEDDAGRKVERYVVGLSMDEVVEAITLSTDGSEHAVGIYDKPKKKRKRRTHAQMLKDAQEEDKSTGEDQGSKL